jgi:hypothetical protein
VTPPREVLASLAATSRDKRWDGRLTTMRVRPDEYVRGEARVTTSLR